MNSEHEKSSLLSSFLSPDLLRFACIIAAVLLFLAGVFVPVDAAWVTTLVFIEAAVLAFYDLIFDAVMLFVKRREIDKNLLVVLAAFGAFFIGKEIEGTAVALLLAIGDILLKKAVEHFANNVQTSLDLRPDIISAIVSGAVVQQPIGKLKVGDMIRVAPGEFVALDGIVVDGNSELNTSGLTGVSLRKTVSEGCEVTSGCINLTGVLNIRVTSDFDNSTVTRILGLIEQGEGRKSKLEKKLKRFAQIYTPAIVVLAIIAATVIPLAGRLPFPTWISRALSLLVVSSPYALMIAVPLTYFAGICRAAGEGILFKGANVVDVLARATSVIFGKTGTLTTGYFQVVDVNAYGVSEERLLVLAAYAGFYSKHPISRSIVAAANVNIDESVIEDYHLRKGLGIEAKIAGIAVSTGNAQLMEELGITPDISQADRSVVYVAINGKYAGRILLRDTVKPDSKKAVRELRAIGIDRIAIFTGDKKEVAADVASQLGITEYYAECLPEDKITRLEGLIEMQLPGDKLIFIGDGINDAPILMMADTGVSMGGLGPDAAIEATDLLIMNEDPSKITKAVELAQKTKKLVEKNIVLWLVLKGLILLFILMGIVSLWLAVFIDVCVSLILVLNAMRAFATKTGI